MAELLAIIPNLTALKTVNGFVFSEKLLVGNEVALDLSKDSSASYLYDELHWAILSLCFSSLTALDFSYTELGKVSHKLAGSLSKLTGLTSLGLSGCIMNSSGENVCKMDWLFQLSCLRVLDLSDNIWTVYDLVQGLNDQSRETLEALFLNDICDEYDTYEDIIDPQPSKPLPVLPALTELDLGGNILEHSLVSSLSNLTALKVLNLDGCELKRDVWVTVGMVLRSGGLDSLTSLDMSGCNQDAKAGLAVAAGLSHLTALQNIKLWGNLHGEGTCAAVLSTLLGLSTLEEVGLDCGPSLLIQQLRSGGTSVLLWSEEDHVIEDKDESFDESGQGEVEACEGNGEDCQNSEECSEDEDEDYDELEDELMTDMDEVLPALMQEVLELHAEAEEHQSAPA